MPATPDFDLVIIGAGIQGASIARQAGEAGLRILLLEQFPEPAMGTSSRSSKLIHGGLRYLESLEFGLVYECLSDRARLLLRYPDLVKLDRFYIPVYKQTRRSALVIRAGLMLYALLGGMRQANRFRTLQKAEWQELDGLDTNGLLTVFEYFDARTDDRLLTRRLLDEAQGYQAQVRYNAPLLACAVNADSVEVRYQDGAGTGDATAKYLVNAGGPWVNDVLDRCQPAQDSLAIDLVQGTHIELPGTLTRGVYYLESPVDGRAVFAIPWHGQILVGTTELIYAGDPANTRPTETEMQYLLSVYNHYFNNQVTQEQVINSWSGLRVLPKGTDNPFKRSRETIFLPGNAANPRVYSIYGGKLTSHYSMAMKLLSKIQAKGV